MSDLRITLCQTNIIWQEPILNRSHLDRFLDNLETDKTDLIIFPEMFTTGFSMDSIKLGELPNGPSIEWMKLLANQKNAAVAGSLIIKEKDTYRNRLVWVEPGVEFLKYYDKKHLFTLAGEQNHYKPGNQKLIINYKSWKIALFICYDLRFPVWSRNTEGVDLMIFVANFPEKREQAWNCLLPARAIENQCFVAGINRVGVDGNQIYYRGDSAIYNFEGSKILDLGVQEKYLTSKLDFHSLQVYKRAYPFLADQDPFHFK